MRQGLLENVYGVSVLHILDTCVAAVLFGISQLALLGTRLSITSPRVSSVIKRGLIEKARERSGARCPPVKCSMRRQTQPVHSFTAHVLRSEKGRIEIRSASQLLGWIAEEGGPRRRAFDRWFQLV